MSAYLSTSPGKFKRGDRVRKIKGSSWHGIVVGEYFTSLTPIGFCVESEREPGSVQLYPEAALELVESQSPGALQTPIGDDDSVAVITRPSRHEFDRINGICRRCGRHAAMAAGQPCVRLAAEAPHGEPVEPRGAGQKNG